MEKKIHYLTFDFKLGPQFKVTHYVTNGPAKSPIATCNGLKGDAFAIRYIIYPVHI